MEAKGADALILLNPSNITYATGARDPSGVLVLSRKCGDSLIVPLLDYHRASRIEAVEVYAFYRGSEEGIKSEIPPKKLFEGTLTDALKKLLDNCSTKRIADISLASYQVAKSIVEKLEAEDASRDIMKIRSVKDENEINLIIEAVNMAERAFSTAFGSLEEGVSETDIATLIESEMRKKGSWAPAFPTIVGFYSNTAFPHHSPGWDRLSVPGPVLIDWGAIYKGYRSDTTRTMWWGVKAPAQFQKHLESIIEAVYSALDLLGPGVIAGDVDNAARKTLEKAGLSKYFIHGLGHGVGVDVHEEPYLRPASKTELEPGMIVTIEPGIYLPGLYGIRIENTVLVTKTGYRILNTLPQEIPL